MRASTDVTLQNAITAMRAGDQDAADGLFRQTLQMHPKHLGALNLFSIFLMTQGRLEEAEHYIRLALNEYANSDTTLYNYGLILKSLRRPAEALERFTQALQINPAIAETWNNRGTVFNDLKQYDDAIKDFDRALTLNPAYAEAFFNKGKSLSLLKRYDEAFSTFEAVLTLKPGLAEAWVGRGNVLFEWKRYDDALAAYDQALVRNAELAEAWLGCGSVFHQFRRREEALAAFDKALALKPDLAEAWLGRANVLNDAKRYDEALNAYNRALALDTELLKAWLGRGALFDQLARHNEAIDSYAAALRIDAQSPFTKGAIVHQKMLCCAWGAVDSLIAEIDRDISSGKPAAEPFGYQGIARSPLNLRLCAELFNRETCPLSNRVSLQPRIASHKKIRIGYLSGELRDHATSHLIVGVLEHHDRSRFEIFAIDNGWNDRSVIRRRIETAVCGTISVSQLSDASAAAAISDQEIDILVNLNGYFGQDRTRVFAMQPAPIQVNYLGFPGTMGASFMHYLIADRCVVPPNHQPFYTEKIVYLPECYQANDDKKEIGTRIFNRAEWGLPQQGFVFCCFNNSYKITSDVFDCWMRILKLVEGSVLWLIEGNASVAVNLRNEAATRCIDPARLVFSKRIPLAEHLARHRLADLFLDTLPYNAHTTASDALWAGLPILTQIGETFPGRVAASLLHAIDLPELITSSRQAYENLAIELATIPQKLITIKQKLANNRRKTSLFDTEAITRHIETAFGTMYARHKSGLPPVHIDVSQI